MIKSIFKGLLFVLLFGIVYGFTIPNYEWYVTDTVGIFSETEKADLTSKIENIEQITNAEIAILVVPSIDDDINLAAVDVGNNWWVGKEGQDNGIVVLLAIDDRTWSIQVGYGLEWTLPDLMTKRIGEARFPENFRAWDYYQWVSEMLDDVLAYIQQDPIVMAKYSEDTSSDNGFNEDYFEFISILFFIIVWWFGHWITVPSNIGKKRKMKKYGRWIYAGVWLWFAFLVTLFVASILASLFISYISLGIGVLLALSGASWRGGMWFWWGWGSNSWWWGWWFGWFGWWSFGGGGSSWSW